MGRSEATGTGVATVVVLVAVLLFAGVIVGLDGSTAGPARSDAPETVAEHRSGVETASPNEMRVDAGSATAAGAAAAPKTARLSGQVIDENGDPVFNATVAVKGGTRRTTTASDGYYDLEIKPGTNEIVIAADDYQRETTTVNVSADDWKRLDVTLSFKPTRIVGTFTADNGTPLENATVTVVDTSLETGTDRNGSYELDVGSGTHMLEASADGYDSWRTVVSVPEYRTVEQNFTLALSGGDTDETDKNESDDGEANESDESNRTPGNETNESVTETAPKNESDTGSPNESESDPKSESNVASSDPPSLRVQLHQLLVFACLFLTVLVTATVAGLYWNRTYEP